MMPVMSGGSIGAAATTTATMVPANRARAARIDRRNSNGFLVTDFTLSKNSSRRKDVGTRRHRVQRSRRGAVEAVEAVEAASWPKIRRLGVYLPMPWIEEALEKTGTASTRSRRLPAEQVVSLVIALALFRCTAMLEALESLDLALPNGDASAVREEDPIPGGKRHRHL